MLTRRTWLHITVQAMVLDHLLGGIGCPADVRRELMISIALTDCDKASDSFSVRPKGASAVGHGKRMRNVLLCHMEQLSKVVPGGEAAVQRIAARVGAHMSWHQWALRGWFAECLDGRATLGETAQ